MANWPFIQNGAPVHIVSCDDVYLYTKEGQQILDAAAGAIASNIGYGRQEVADAVAKATLNTGYVIPIWLTDEREELVDRLLKDWLPVAFNRMHFNNGGSEANESAMKIAIQYHAAQGRFKRTKIIGRDISYHGTTISTTAVGGHALRKKGLEHFLSDYPTAQTPYPLRCEDPEPTSYYLAKLEELLHQEGPETIAAIIGEPIIGASGGAIVPPDGYWEGVRAICDEHEILIIDDEIMTGFGRTGKRWGYQHWDMVPDIIVGGKGLAAGYAPLNGVFSTDKVALPLQEAGLNVMFHTYSAHPPGCAAANKVLEIMERENLVDRCRAMGTVLETKLRAAFSNHPHVAEARGKGLLQSIEIVEDRSTLKHFPESEKVAHRVASHAFKNGVNFYAGGTGEVRDIILIGPPMTINESHVDTMVETLLDSVDHVVASVN